MMLEVMTDVIPIQKVHTEDQRAALPAAAREVTAAGVWALRLSQVVPSGRAGCRCIAISQAAQLSPLELTARRNELFNKEKRRQLSLTPQTEKIEVKHIGKTNPGTVFVMNKNVSTPYSCAMHLSEWYCKKSILALVDRQPWDMYKPLTKSCEIELLTFKDHDPGEVSKAYWRSCAMKTGCVIERAFKNEFTVILVRALEVPVIAGAFCYDVILDERLDEWVPTKENLRSFTKDVHALIYKDLPFETLEVEAKVALEIFQNNKYKIKFIEEKSSQKAERKVKLHRKGDFIDVSEGPLIPRTSVCYQYEVPVVHSLQPTQPNHVPRFQGLSLPIHLRLQFTIWDKLLERSWKLVTGDQSKWTEENVTTR
ncbi:LOW QUALITY PROTEIN: large ribosomal subunit protein mL39-like [Ochotona princeps]|uniref:LOW QUALITY PROTEIN: large ribosomal subunit protein mL39-like n=1 Tax=Ochotona princeps TaxID=9978 RepID=UPI0027153DA3|nr:LOW QUALITY PROTEIN: large ribosomal subunit protein mL39-like [Ochotona princeps]